MTVHGRVRHGGALTLDLRIGSYQLFVELQILCVCFGSRFCHTVNPSKVIKFHPPLALRLQSRPGEPIMNNVETSRKSTRIRCTHGRACIVISILTLPSCIFSSRNDRLEPDSRTIPRNGRRCLSQHGGGGAVSAARDGSGERG